MWELTKGFRFEAAHTLSRRIEVDASRRIHGHSYRVVITIRGDTDPATGMVIDLGVLEASLSGARAALDHRMLDDIPELGPATLENLSAWIWRQMTPIAPGLKCVTVCRESLDDSCSYYGPST